MTKFLIENGADVNSKGFEDWRPLHVAAKNGIVQKYLNYTCTFKCWQSCDFQSNVGRLETVQVLIDHGADVNATDKNGNTALHEAASHGNFFSYHNDVQFFWQSR